MKDRSRHWPMILAGLVLGFGLAGLLDGILFRQILQWHHMLSDAGYPDTTISGLEVNTLADGVFAALMWLLTMSGLVCLWRTSRALSIKWSGRMLSATMLTGAGLFYLIEGIVDHYLLGLHHVKPGPGQGFWDFFFLLVGVGLVVAGIALEFAAPRARPDRMSQMDKPIPPDTRPPESTSRLRPRH